MTALNQIVNVNAFYFQNGRGLRSFPKQIEFGNTRFTFQDGLQYSVQSSGHLIKLYDMSDGHTNYRLRLEDDTWTLIGTRTLS